MTETTIHSLESRVTLSPRTMESEHILLSIGLGAGLGIVYIFASYISNKHVLRSGSRFMLLLVSTMMLRLVIALLLLLGILLLLPVSDVAFLGSFFVIFAIGLIIEIRTLHRAQPPPGADHT